MKTISEKPLERPTSGYTPTHPGAGKPLDTLSIGFLFFHLWSFMRREMGPLSVNLRGSSLVCTEDKLS
jgi:hypothetical protein